MDNHFLVRPAAGKPEICCIGNRDFSNTYSEVVAVVITKKKKKKKNFRMRNNRNSAASEKLNMARTPDSNKEIIKYTLVVKHKLRWYTCTSSMPCFQALIGSTLSSIDQTTEKDKHIGCRVIS